MKKLLTRAVIALTVFGISAGGSWYAANQAKDEEAEQTIADEQLPARPVENADGPPREEELPVPVRPKPMTPEEIVRHAMELRERESQLEKRREKLTRDEARLKLISTDVEAERQELESLRAEVNSQIQQAQQLLQKVLDGKQEVITEREATKKELESFEDQQLQIQEGESANLKKMSSWFEAMESEKAAEYLRELANDGKLDMAVKLLSNLEERDASKILAAMDDAALVVQIAERFTQLKRETKQQGNGRRR